MEGGRGGGREREREREEFPASHIPHSVQKLTCSVYACVIGKARHVGHYDSPSLLSCVLGGAGQDSMFHSRSSAVDM